MHFLSHSDDIQETELFLVENFTLCFGHLNMPRAVVADVILRLDTNLLYFNLSQHFQICDLRSVPCNFNHSE